jgi:RNA polymerase sigma factor (sigma-70 family)
MDQIRAQIRAVLNGDARAFAKLVDQHKRLVSHIVFRLIPAESDREDLCQDVFLKVYQNLDGFHFNAKLSTWIARIAYNTCLNFLDKKRESLYEDLAPVGETLDSLPVDNDRPDTITEQRQQAVRLCEEIDQLPVQYGLILSLYHLQDMSYAEIGRILSMPDGTVKSYLFRARRLLKERLVSRAAEEKDYVCAVNI